MAFFLPFKGHDSGVSGAIKLSIDLGRDIMPLSIVIKVHEDPIKADWHSEPKHLALARPPAADVPIIRLIFQMGDEYQNTGKLTMKNIVAKLCKTFLIYQQTKL